MVMIGCFLVASKPASIVCWRRTQQVEEVAMSRLENIVCNKTHVYLLILVYLHRPHIRVSPSEHRLGQLCLLTKVDYIYNKLLFRCKRSVMAKELFNNPMIMRYQRKFPSGSSAR